MVRVLDISIISFCILFSSFFLKADELYTLDENSKEQDLNTEPQYSYELPYEEREDVRIRSIETQTFLLVQNLIREYLKTKDIDFFKSQIEKIDHDEEHETMFFQGFSDLFYNEFIKELKGSNILIYKKNAIFPFSSFRIATLNNSFPQSLGGITEFSSSIWEKIRSSYFPDRSMERHQSRFDRTLLGPLYIVDKNTLFIVGSMIIFTSFDNVLLLNIEKEEYVNRIIRKFSHLDDYNKKYVLWYLDYLRQYNYFERKTGLDYKDLPLSKKIVVDVMRRLLIDKSKLKSYNLYLLSNEWQLNIWYEGYTDYYEQFSEPDSDSECEDMFSE